MTTFSQQRKPLDKILELGKETGWVIAYEPDTKEFGGGSFETLNWESNGRCWMMDVLWKGWLVQDKPYSILGNSVFLGMHRFDRFGGWLLLWIHQYSAADKNLKQASNEGFWTSPTVFAGLPVLHTIRWLWCWSSFWSSLICNISDLSSAGRYNTRRYLVLASHCAEADLWP